MEPMRAQLTNPRRMSEKMFNSRVNIAFYLFFQGVFYQLVLKLKKPVEQLVTLLGMLRKLLVMGLVTQLELLVRE
jgi:hypothetical protein